MNGFKYYCIYCCYGTNDKTKFRRHKYTDKHIKLSEKEKKQNEEVDKQNVEKLNEEKQQKIEKFKTEVIENCPKGLFITKDQLNELKQNKLLDIIHMKDFPSPLNKTFYENHKDDLDDGNISDIITIWEYDSNRNLMNTKVRFILPY
jgi:2',3'-cyclic-nucleotide 2'-phosphodiesterase (5'-nucleotidase family)